MNSGVLFALLLCLGCGLWIGAEARQQRSVYGPRCLAGWTPFYNRCVRFTPHHRRCPAGWAQFHSRCVRFTPHHRRCPAGWAQFHHRCVRFSPHHRICPAGWAQFHQRCVLFTPHHRICPAGWAPFNHRCVRFTHHHRRCPVGWAPFNHRCVKFNPYRPVPRRGCPPGWSQYGNRCFLFINTDSDWNNAENFCHGIGGHLASFHSYNELNFLRNLVLRFSGSFRNTWVGGTDILENRVWRWTDGSPYNYNHWYPGEPNNWMGREPCMEINFRGSDGNNDEKCYSRRPFICSRRI